MIEFKTYPGLESKYELSNLIDQALNILKSSPIQETVQADLRLGCSPIGYASTEYKRILGFMCILNIVFGILNGSEARVSGICARYTPIIWKRVRITKT